MNDKLDRLIRQYRLMLCRLAFVYVKNIDDAEDVVQDVFVYVLTKDVSFHDEEHERAWLIRSVIHRSLNLLKRSSKKNISLDTLHTGPASPSGTDIPGTAGFPGHAEAKQTSQAVSTGTPEYGFVLDAVMMLPPKYRSIIHLYYFEGYDQDEISCMLDMPLSTVKTRMVRGRKRLKKILKEEFDYEE